MRVLIGGEYSGTIRDAFIAQGHDAMSCDLSATTVPGPHHKGDWREVMYDGWDIGIFHPTCTYMANSGALNLFRNRSKNGGINEDRWLRMGKDAWEFWNLLEHCPIPHICIENPIMLGYAQTMVGRKPTQIIQPYDYGSNASKATCLWLKGLPKLIPTKRVAGRLVEYNGKIVERWENQTDSGQNKEAPTKDPEQRRMIRSKTFPGIATAMAAQWSLASVGECVA